MSEPAAFDPAVARALDHFDVPPPSAGFLERLAAMPEASAPALPPLPRRRTILGGRRGAWMRRTGLGVIALGLASATAAATGVFEALHIALPPPIVALVSPPPKHAPVHRHTKRAAPVANTAALPAAAPSPGGEISPLAATDPQAPLRRFIRREQTVAFIQNRLAARGIDVPKPVIRRELAVRQLAIGAAIRGDTATPLPPRIDAMRARASAYLDAHPNLRDRLRERAAAADAAHDQRVAETGTPAADGAAPGAPDSTPQPLNWTERRMRWLRRQQLRQQYWAAQRQENAAVTTESAPPSEGNSAAPR